jgi:hypothetical protein
MDSESFNILVHPKSNIPRSMGDFSFQSFPEAAGINDLQRQRFVLLMIALPKNRLRGLLTMIHIDSHLFRITKAVHTIFGAQNIGMK